MSGAPSEPTMTGAGAPETAPALVGSVWARLSLPRRRFIVLGSAWGVVLVFLASVWWGLQILAGATPGDGILFAPMIVSVAVFAFLIGASVVLVLRAAGSDQQTQTLARLGAVWALASVPLMFDYLIDSFPGKLIVNALFVVAGIRYWKGLRNSYLALFLAPLTALIAAADGVGHLTGSFCSTSSSLDACPAKAVSDFYLVMLLIGITAVTLAGRTQRPDPKKLALYILILVLLFLGFAFAPF